MTAPRPVALELERHRLDNGLEVVLHPDRSFPLVAVNLWYHVGSSNEAPGKTGFAHLFEHLLFQGSENVGTNDHFRHVQQAGGTANGSTWFDRTNYHELMPAHQLDLALWLEADRMGFFLPAIDQEKLDNQRDVVINERRQRIDNQPYGRAFERLHEMLYGEGHPYSWPVIGYIPDLEAVTLSDVEEFFARFYVPRNTVLTLAGDLPPDAMDRVERYFGEIPGGEPVAQPEVSLPVGAGPGERRDVLADQVELSRVYLGYQVPPFGQRSWYAADALAGLLADGKSSRLYADLVYRRELAQEVSVSVLPTEKAATFVLTMTAAPGVDPEVLEEAVDEHLDRLAEAPPPEEELDRVCRRLEMAHYYQLQTLDRRADLLSTFTTYFDDPGRLATEAERYRDVTVEDLSAVVRAFLTHGRRASVTVVPEAVVPEADGAANGEEVAS